MFPVSLVHMELAARCSQNHMHMEVSHVKRDKNTWADELSNVDTEAWDPDKQWTSDLGPDCFLVLDTLASLLDFNRDTNKICWNEELIPRNRPAAEHTYRSGETVLTLGGTDEPHLPISDVSRAADPQ